MTTANQLGCITANSDRVRLNRSLQGLAAWNVGFSLYDSTTGWPSGAVDVTVTLPDIPGQTQGDARTDAVTAALACLADLASITAGKSLAELLDDIAAAEAAGEDPASKFAQAVDAGAD